LSASCGPPAGIENAFGAGADVPVDGAAVVDGADVARGGSVLATGAGWTERVRAHPTSPTTTSAPATITIIGVLEGWLGVLSFGISP
jgi:hypothetical protein